VYHSTLKQLQRCLLAALTLLCLLPYASVHPAPNVPTHASTGQAATEHRILLNFRGADITQLITLMSDLTGKTFVVDNKVRGTVTLVSPNPVSLDEAYQVFLAVLKSQGFTAVPQGPIVKIIPAPKAKESPLPYRD
jgi:general secretion pathway protein D